MNTTAIREPNERQLLQDFEKTEKQNQTTPIEFGEQALLAAALPGQIQVLEKAAGYLDQGDWEGAADAGLTICLETIGSHLESNPSGEMPGPFNQKVQQIERQYGDTVDSVNLAMRIVGNQPEPHNGFAGRRLSTQELPESFQKYDYSEYERATQLVSQEIRYLIRTIEIIQTDK